MRTHPIWFSFWFCLLVHCLWSAALQAEIAYFSDAEGLWEKYQDFISHNENFFSGADGKYHLKPGAHFVFGGDVPDRGNGSLRIVADLLRLKSESEDRVAFTIGNRDGNKLRLRTELGQAALSRPVENPGYAPWLGARPDNRTHRLQWMLEKTMGAPKAFEFRREELAILSGRKTGAVTDEEVVQSYIKEMSPGGDFYRYLQDGVLAHRIGNSLFTHFGVTEQTLGYVPDSNQPWRGTDIWIQELNQWYRDQIALAAQLPSSRENPAQKLLNYIRVASGRAEDNPGQYGYGKNADAANNPYLPSDAVIERLIADGIYREVHGHTPTGMVPVVLRRGSRFESVWADNSYAPSEHHAHQINFTGPEFSTTQIQAWPLGIPGVDKISFSLMRGIDSPIGQRTRGGDYVIAQVPGLNGPEQLLFHLAPPSFRSVYKLVPPHVTQRQGSADPVKKSGAIACPKHFQEMAHGRR